VWLLPQRGVLLPRVASLLVIAPTHSIAGYSVRETYAALAQILKADQPVLLVQRQMDVLDLGFRKFRRYSYDQPKLIGFRSWSRGRLAQP
jgi:hypothetical protein